MSTRKGRTITILKPKRGSQEATSDLEGKSCERAMKSFSGITLKRPKNNTLTSILLHFDVSVELSTERPRKPSQCGSHG